MGKRCSAPTARSRTRGPLVSTSGFALLTVGGTVLFFSLTPVGWGIGFGLWLTRRTTTVHSEAARFARSTASVFAGAAVVSIFDVVRIAGSMDPTTHGSTPPFSLPWYSCPSPS
jgi:hypothetical protein